MALVGYWSFDFDAKDVYNDNDFTANSVAFAAAHRGNGCVLAGSISSYLIRNPMAFPTDAVTAMYWAKSDIGGNADEYIFSYAVTGRDNEFLIKNGSALQAIVRSVGLSAGGGDQRDNLFHFYVAKWRKTDGNFKLKRDNVTVINATGPTLSLTTGGALVIGQEQDAVGGGFNALQCWKGTIDELALFDHYTTDAEDTNFYNNGILAQIGITKAAMLRGNYNSDMLRANCKNNALRANCKVSM